MWRAVEYTTQKRKKMKGYEYDPIFIFFFIGKQIRKTRMLLKVSKNAEPDAENAYASFQGLLQLAKITNADVDLSRGACKKCGRVGHLKFQCKNYVKLQDEKVEKDLEAMQPLGLVGIDNLKGKSELETILFPASPPPIFFHFFSSISTTISSQSRFFEAPAALPDLQNIKTLS
ncbi:unnamed protein product [Trifolium pratense]|uniref:Uncharacterized protein n=1 Tax=Trifolium pratense TaxID=57577 RepID=A0ACB0JNW3_TRIPR|nr:unnamed protein product [Trifolium pratense]